MSNIYWHSDGNAAIEQYIMPASCYWQNEVATRIGTGDMENLD
jgi:hypothetical protein